MLLGVASLHEEDLEETLLREHRAEVEQVPTILVGAGPADLSGFPWRDAHLIDGCAARGVGDTPDHRERARVREQLLRLLLVETRVVRRGDGFARATGCELLPPGREVVDVER